MFIIFIDMDYHLLYNAVVNRNNNYYQNQKTLRKKRKKAKILQKMPKCNINIKKK